MTMPFRQEIELLQNYPKHKTFTVVMANNYDAQDVVTLSGTMEECNKISFRHRHFIDTTGHFTCEYTLRSFWPGRLTRSPFF